MLWRVLVCGGYVQSKWGAICQTPHCGGGTRIVRGEGSKVGLDTKSVAISSVFHLLSAWCSVRSLNYPFTLEQCSYILPRLRPTLFINHFLFDYFLSSLSTNVSSFHCFQDLWLLMGNCCQAKLVLKVVLNGLHIIRFLSDKYNGRQLWGSLKYC